MMKKHTDLPAGSPRSRCFANLHMTMEEYALWDVLRSLSHSTGTVYFDGRSIAGYFAGTGKNTIYRIVKSLIKKGWIFVQSEGQRGRNGVFIPSQYQVLSHEQWAEIHPGECVAADPGGSSPRNGTGPVPEPEIEDEPVPELGPDQSQNREQPVPESVLTSPENGNGPVPESVLTSPGTGTYIVKEISLSGDSSVGHAEEGDTDPSIPLCASRKERDGWLVGCLCSLLQENADRVTVPNDEEIRDLNALAAKHGDLAVLLAFNDFTNRDKTFLGVGWPLKLFLKEAGVWVRVTVRRVDDDAPSTEIMDWLWGIVAKPLREHFEYEEAYPLGKLAEDVGGDFVVDYLKNHRQSQIIADIEKINAMRDQEAARRAA